MSTDLKNFIEAAGQATAIGESERREEAEKCAAAFLASPDSFTPARLLGLGRAGVQVFIEALGVPAAGHHDDQKPVSEGEVETPPCHRAPPQGWAELRRRETDFLIVSVSKGAIVSVVLTGLSILVSVLN